MAEDTSKIYVDDDWKKQAREDKQRLSEKEKESESPRPAAAPAGPLPDPTLTTLISSFLSQVLLSLGLLEQGPQPPVVNIDLAKFNIGMLEVLEQKTQGNLTEQEKDLLDHALHQARMAFVDVASRQGPIG